MTTVRPSLPPVVVALLVVSLFSVASTADAQESDRHGGRSLTSVDRGFLFVNGQHIPRPYVFRKLGDSYFVNEINLATVGIEISDYATEAWGGAEGDGRSKNGQRKMRRVKERTPIAMLWQDIRVGLFSSDMILLISGLPPI